MQFAFLKNNLLIICPTSYKKAILKYLADNKLILNIKFMTMNEYLKAYLFDYDEKTIYYLVKQGMKVDNAKTLIQNLYYVKEKNYQNEKLNYLVQIKKELENHNLLIYDNLFHKMFKKYQIVIYGYGQIDSWKKNLLNNPQIIDYEQKNEKYQVYDIKNIADEVEFVFQKIADLLEQGVNINQISLMNIDEEYLPILKRFSLLYQIPLDIPSNGTLLGTTMGQEFYQLVLEGRSKEDIFAFMEKYQENRNYSLLVNLLNKYIDFPLLDVALLIKNDLEGTSVYQKTYENVVKIKKVFDYIGDDEYVFLMNFNSPSIPSLSMDIDYITDNIKDLVGLDKTSEINKLMKDNTMKYISSIKNLIISYKEVTPFNTYYPSILLDDMNYELLNYNRSFNYSDAANKSLYTMDLDDYLKYGIKNKDLGILYHNYGENDYLNYHNDWTGIKKENLLSYLNNELTLSYSSIDNYYKCGFRYYLSNILKIDLYEETFMTIIGSLFHEVLRHMNDQNFDLDYYYHHFVGDKKFSFKEKFFLDKLKKDLEFVIMVLKKHQFITGFNRMLYEEKIDIPLKKSPYVHFKGFVDKIMFQEKNNETLVSIIDYKTGSFDIKIKNLAFGLSMQLPIYLYLVNNSHLFKNIKWTGFYLQHILNNSFKSDKKSLEEQKYDNMKLVGYSSSDIERLSVFDSTYESSEMIKGMKINQDGTFSHYANTLSDKEIEDIIQLTEKKIIEAMDEILNGHFPINPKIIDTENVSCMYCSFNDICYREEKDKVYLKSEEGDENA